MDTETLETYNFDPVSIEIGDEIFYFINYDVAVDFIREYQEQLGSVIEGAELSEDQDYIMEDLEFHLTAETALDIVFNS